MRDTLAIANSPHRRTDMDRQQILDLYSWAPGVCFRHPAEGVADTAVVKTIHPRTGPAEDVRACRPCVVAMEATRRVRAMELGLRYEPGRAGDPLDGY
ncbi:hypothetical protein OOK39_01900 [Streptomyces sp. NBC_00264]|uniref:hypothetical protein n=1 Tax=unclassified Streptomyces TaxID=2593676 RepID=UPI002257F41F|nr:MULTISPECIES: hypothetical protein [unclassified Streptomyces]MCX5158054.1 hypothetical protein [Streptomyces sp. NBC_00305]MCX5216577.1 hypothetical protein [Streptomyces sp. NBC_00264]